jgi:hypothetical protein
MGLFRRIFWATLVWLTAAATLFAGFPHVVCRCCDGNAPQRTGTTGQEVARCCSQRSCCAPSETKPVENEKATPTSQRKARRSCCSKSTSPQPEVQEKPDRPEPAPQTASRAPTTSKDQGASQIRSACCDKGLVQAEAATLAEPKSKTESEPASPTLVLTVIAKSDPLISCGLVASCVCCPPPTDLVTILQRLTI